MTLGKEDGDHAKYCSYRVSRRTIPTNVHLMNGRLVLKNLFAAALQVKVQKKDLGEHIFHIAMNSSRCHFHPQ